MAYAKVSLASIPPRHRHRHRRLCRVGPLTPPPLAEPNLYTVSFYNEPVFVTVAKKAIHVDQWISNILRGSSAIIGKILVGLDTEWLPNMAPGEDHPIAVIQLCIGHHCLIFQALHSDCIPASLHVILSDPRYVFCGVGIDGDIKKLQEHHGLRVRCSVDLNHLRRMATGEDEESYRYLGLKKMAAAVLGKIMKKPLRVTLSKWDNTDLDDDQIEYAAIDAFVSMQLGLMLFWSIRKRNAFIFTPGPGMYGRN